MLENRLGYVEEEARDVRAGKDIRLYGMAGWFTALRERLMDDYSQVRRDIAARDFRAALVDALLLLLRDGAAYAYLIYQATQGRIGAGDFVLYAGAIAGFGGFISGIVGQFGLLQDASERMNDVRSFLEQSNAPDPADPLPPPQDMPSIEFRDVCFSYDGEHNVLDHLSLFPRARRAAGAGGRERRGQDHHREAAVRAVRAGFGHDSDRRRGRGQAAPRGPLCPVFAGVPGCGAVPLCAGGKRFAAAYAGNRPGARGRLPDARGPGRLHPGWWPDAPRQPRNQ